MFVKVQPFQCRGEDVYLVLSPIVIEESKIVSTISPPKHLLQLDDQSSLPVMMNSKVSQQE